MPVVEELKRGKKVTVKTEELAPVVEQTAAVEDGIEKPKTKRVMTEAQKANLAKGRAARAAKLTGRPAADPEPEPEPEPPKQKKASKPPKIVYEEEEEDSEPEVVIVKKKKAPAKKPAKVVYEEESEDEPPKPKKKAAPRKAKAEPKEAPAVEKPVRHVEIRQPVGFLRFV